LFLRHTTIQKNGKPHVYWRLVRSVRHGRRVYQQTVAHLGELDEEGRARAGALAKHFLGERATQRELFEDTESYSPMRVHLNQVRVERGRAFGDVWLGWNLWRAVGLDRFFDDAMTESRATVSWSQMAAVLVLARLCEPASELHIAETWYRGTALEDLLVIPPSAVHHTRLYEALDRILPHKRELETHLKDRLGTLFSLDYDLLLYDVTSTYFEGLAEGNPMAARGYSRDHRPDCKQVCIGLVVTREGYPLGYEIFKGNRVDVTTMEEMVETMESRYGKARRIWVMDRGMVSEDNLEWMRQGQRRYLVGTPRSELRKWEREIVDRRGWKEVREGLEVKICDGPDGKEKFLLCRSEDRTKKERAMHERFSQRIVEGLGQIKRRLEKSTKALDSFQVERQIGRLMERNRRAAGRYVARLEKAPESPSGWRLVWGEKSGWSEWASLSEGTYILRSNVLEWTPEELWRTYIQLSEAEAAFRIQKSELRIRPIWHQHQDRVEAHILVCFLAYVLWKTLQGWQEKAHLGSSPRTILEELHRIQSVDVVLPIESGREMTLRCVVRPDASQAALLDRLGLRLPLRLKRPSEIAKCSANRGG
jgi:transposase